MIIRYDPFRELDRLSRQLWGAPEAGTVGAATMPLDVRRYPDRVEAVFDLPGVDPDSIDVVVERDTLTVRAQRSPVSAEGGEVLVNERPQGRFSRQLSLGQSLDTARVSAHYDRGVLTLTVPIAETSKAQRIRVTTGSAGDGSPASGTIDAPSSEVEPGEAA